MNKYELKENETLFEYAIRLFTIKIEESPEDLGWDKIVELLGLTLHPDTLRKSVSVGPFCGYRVAAHYKQEMAEKGVSKSGEAYLTELRESRQELEKERQMIRDERTAYRKMLREEARKDANLEILNRAIEEGKIPNLTYVEPNVDPATNDLLISLNDLHYGASVNNFWNYYNSTVCRQFMAEYASRVICIGKENKSESCFVWANGDMISGNIHKAIAISNRENVIEQLVGVSELISEFLAELSHHFAKVVFVSVAGNHSRIEKKDDASIHERLDDLVEWYLKARLQNFENIDFNGYRKIDDTMYLLNVRGKTYLGVHGDYDGSESKVQSLKTMAQEPVYAVLSGHLHHNKIDNVQGVKTIMAGSFLGMDDYCVSKRIYGAQQQLVCVCTEDGVRAFYDIDFDSSKYRP